MAGDLLHDDYAYVFEGSWDLWGPNEESDQWTLEPRLVKFIANGKRFDDESFQQNGHIQIDFGLDTPFLYEDLDLSEIDEARVRSNVQKLVQFTQSVEKNCGISGRVLW